MGHLSKRAPGTVLFAIIIGLFAGSAFSQASPAVLTLDDIRKEIDENGYSWTTGRTEIYDMPAEERESLLGLRVPDDYAAILEEIENRPLLQAPMDLPSRFDWTDSGVVSPVRRQLCGDCWAQCSVAAMESQLMLYDDDLTTRLSVQQAIDCNFGNSGCDGGWWEDVYNLYMAVGAVTQACFPYRNGHDGNCDQDTCEIVARLDGYEYVDTTVVSIKNNLMTYGPMAVAMAVVSDFYGYTGGCYETSLTGSINHGVLIVGWDDSMCGGAGAWHIKNSWGTSWGDGGFAWMKYGTAQIGYGAAVTYYTPRERVRLVYDSSVIDDSSEDGDGIADPGETVVLEVSIANDRWNTATSVSATLMSVTPGVQVLSPGSADFPDVPGGAVRQTNSPHYSIYVDPSVPCGRRAHFTLSIECDQGTYSDNFDFDIGDAAEVVFADNCQSGNGWTLGVPGDDGTAGSWTLKNPRGSFQDGYLVQAELDHTPGPLVNAYLTANANRSFAPDMGDVDGGSQTLLTPVFDLSDRASAHVRYWKWYTNDTDSLPPDDVWITDVSADGGATWVNLETQTESRREWVESEFDLSDHIPLTDQVQLRFIASDYGEESVVEAAVDDFEITGCPAAADVLPPNVEVVSPNGGEEVVENTEVGVEWTVSDDYGLRDVTVMASYDGGLTYEDTLGVFSGFDSMMTWQVPEGDHPECRIGVEAIDRGYNPAFDESDLPFSIIRDVAGVGGRVEEDLPDQVLLVGCEKNPFSGSTHIFFGLPRAMNVRLKVFDSRGRCVRQLLDAPTEAGYHSAVWDGESSSGRRVSPGIYFVRLDAEGTVKTTKVMLAR